MNPEKICFGRAMTRRLKQMIARGEGDSIAADALRDAMDAYWDGLTAAESDELRKIAPGSDYCPDCGSPDVNRGQVGKADPLDERATCRACGWSDTVRDLVTAE